MAGTIGGLPRGHSKDNGHASVKLNRLGYCYYCWRRREEDGLLFPANILYSKITTTTPDALLLWIFIMISKDEVEKRLQKHFLPYQSHPVDDDDGGGRIKHRCATIIRLPREERQRIATRNIQPARKSNPYLSVSAGWRYTSPASSSLCVDMMMIMRCKKCGFIFVAHSFLWFPCECDIFPIIFFYIADK